MSMNLQLSIEGTAIYPGGYTEPIMKKCDLFQTPTDVTYSILDFDSPQEILEEYFKWVRSLIKSDSDIENIEDHISTVQEWIDFYGIDNVDFYFI